MNGCPICKSIRRKMIERVCWDEEMIESVSVDTGYSRSDIIHHKEHCMQGIEPVQLTQQEDEWYCSLQLSDFTLTNNYLTVDMLDLIIRDLKQELDNIPKDSECYPEFLLVLRKANRLLSNISPVEAAP